MKHDDMDVEGLRGWDDLVAAGAVDPPDRKVLDAAALAVAQAARGDRVAARARRRQQGRFTPRRRVLVAAGLAVLVTGGVIAAQSLTVNGRPVVGAQAEAAELLNRAADVTLANGQRPGPGQYLYVRTTTRSLSGIGINTGIADGEPEPDLPNYFTNSVMEEWIPADFSGVWMRHDNASTATFASPRDGARWRASGMLYLEPDERWTARFGDYIERTSTMPEGSWQSPTPDFMAGLPRDPEALRDRLLADQWRGENEAWGALSAVSDAIHTGRVPADLSAAFFRALALVPGVEVVPGVVDLAGRTGVAISAGGSGATEQLIFDRDTGAYLGMRTLLDEADPAHDLEAGVVFGTETMETAVVDRLGQVPTK